MEYAEPVEREKKRAFLSYCTYEGRPEGLRKKRRRRGGSVQIEYTEGGNPLG